MGWTCEERGSECHPCGHIPHEEAAVGWTCEKERREAASVIPVDTYLTRRLQWGGHVRRRGEERGSECHPCGHIPHEKEAAVGWTCEKERREAASVIPVDTYLTRRRLQ